MSEIIFSKDERAKREWLTLDSPESERATLDAQRYDEKDRRKLHTARKTGDGSRHLKLEPEAQPCKE